MTTKVVKIEIIKPINDTWDVLGRVLRDIQYQTWKLANRSIQMLWDFSNFNYSYQQRFGESLLGKGKSLPNGYKNVGSDILNECKEFTDKLNSNSKDAIIKMVTDKWNADFNDIINGRKSIANFKRDLPIELHNNQFMNSKKQLMLYVENGDYYIEINLISKQYAKELGKKSTAFKLLLAVKDNYQKAIVDRLISGEYKLGMSKITKTKKGKTKWYLNLVYSFTEKKDDSLDPNKVMGIDLGVNIPAALAIYGDKYFKEFVGDRDEIENFRKQIESRKRKLQQQSKWCGEGRIGHGIKTRIKPLEKLAGKIANFKNTKNHCWSRYIVDMAVKNKCGVIQMEDLSGIAEENTFLKNWTYYDLQQKIKYKAEEKGIKVIFINPAYTSARCSKCGHIHRSYEKKDWRPSQDQFICQVCGYKENADINAARNIATPNIEKIIKEQLEKQEREQRNQKYVG